MNPSPQNMLQTQNCHVNNGNSSPNDTQIVQQFPLDAIGMIFSWLPIKEAAALGVVAKPFKKAWLFCRRLYFGREIARRHTRSEFIAIVSRVFELHQGPSIYSFTLCLDPTGDEPLVMEWLKIAATKGVEELNLDFFGATNHPKFPLDLSTFRAVRHLKLSFCEINLPLMGNSLHLLETLVFFKVNFPRGLIMSVFENCKLLEKLVLDYCLGIQALGIFTQNLHRFRVLSVSNCFGVHWIGINSPTLRSFYFSGGSPSFSFINITQLRDAVLNFTPRGRLDFDFRVKEYLWDLVRLRTLTISANFIENLFSSYEGGELRQPQFPLLHLSEVQLLMENATHCNLYHIALFLMNTPCVERLFIDLSGCSFQRGADWKIQMEELVEISWVYNNLKVVQVVGFLCQEHELELVEFFLRRALNLEALILLPPTKLDSPIMLPPLPMIYQLLVSWKASERARISLYGYPEVEHLMQPLQ